MTSDRISRRFIGEHPRDAARVFERFEPAAVASYLEDAAPAAVSRLFRYMSPTAVARCLADMAEKQAVETLRLLGVDRAASYLRRMSRADQARLMNPMSKIFSGMLRLVMRYPEGTVGQLMNPDVATINTQTRIENAINILRNMSGELHNEVFVVDDNQKLVGIVDIKDLITVDSTLAAEKIMYRPRHPIPARSGISSAKFLAGHEYRDIYPIVDHKGLFVGILRHEILLEAMKDYTGETSTEMELTSGFLAMADLFWNTFLNMFIPDTSSGNKREEK